MQKLGKLTDGILRQEPTDLEQSSKLPALPEDPRALPEITEMLAACYQAVDVYGLDPESIGDRAKVFLLVLAEYPFAAVREAFITYLRHNKGMPSPADIVAIIDPREPVPDKAVYIELSKKPGELRTDDDWAYMRRYEQWARKHL